MAKSTVIYPYNGILFCNKKKNELLINTTILNFFFLGKSLQ